jgi:hypothetical protein
MVSAAVAVHACGGHLQVSSWLRLRPCVCSANTLQTEPFRAALQQLCAYTQQITSCNILFLVHVSCIACRPWRLPSRLLPHSDYLTLTTRHNEQRPAAAAHLGAAKVGVCNGTAVELAGWVQQHSSHQQLHNRESSAQR